MPRAKIVNHGLLDSWGRQNNRKHPDKKCPVCGTMFKPWRAESKYCSRKCLWSTNGGHNKKIECWWKNSKGYIEGRVTLPDGTRVRIKQHRFVMEGILGRPLAAHEDVHHVNGDKTDNNPDNLELLSHGDHSALSNSQRDYIKGYKLNLTEEARVQRSIHATTMRLSELGRAAIAKAREGK